MKRIMVFMIAALIAIVAKADRPAKVIELGRPIMVSEFQNSSNQQIFKFAPVKATYFAIESRSAWDGQPFAAISEFDVYDAWGQDIPHEKWSVAYVDSEELAKEDGKAENAIDGENRNHWHTRWSDMKPDHPHVIVVNLGAEYEIAGVRYLPRQTMGAGRIRTFAIYAGKDIVK
ncbi:MAG: discoidin domain-containing protein [Kiritimatiellae bacterium]|nr:discoidin domain-containing protein [Kiritimatiellia bacterium]